LIKCAEDKRRYVIQFLWSEGVETNQIYGRIAVQYGITIWARGKFVNERIDSRRARKSVDDNCSEWLSAVPYYEVKKQISQCIWNNERISTVEITSKMIVRYGSAMAFHTIIFVMR
jgi:hypothetical protein